MTYKVVEIGGRAKDLEYEMNRWAALEWREVSATCNYDGVNFMITSCK